jgi:C-methyltransferase C-terminal domain/Putative zinc binding domain
MGLGRRPLEGVVTPAESATSNGHRGCCRLCGEDLRDVVADLGSMPLANSFVEPDELDRPDPRYPFTDGLRALAADDGVLTLEFHHLLRLIEKREFDTIYHEHLSYLSLVAVERLFAEHGLELFDVEELPTHGGSLRIYAAPVEAGRRRGTRGAELRDREEAAGLTRLETYAAFGEAVPAAKRELLGFLKAARRAGQSVVAYGAAAKGNTLLNYCGIDTHLVQYAVDRSPHKQGRYLPGSRLPIREPEHLGETRPDYLLLLAWNLRDEIVDQMRWIKEWGGRFVVPMPELAVID